MVGLADIPCVGEVVDRISRVTVDAMIRGLWYMFCYKFRVNELNSETERLNSVKEKLSRKVKKEEDNGKYIENDVKKWQEQVEDIQKIDEELSPSYSWILNPVSRLRIGWNAEKKAKTVKELIGVGNEFLTKEIAYHREVVNADTTFEEFESRKGVYKTLWDALVNEDSPMIHGIYGMAGVGKTTMMEKIKEDAMKKKIFKEVIRVNVGNENLNETNLQDLIAGGLRCTLESSKGVESRASQLENSLRNKGKILLILDDLWKEIPLEKIIGTRFADGSNSKGSKILLTSRDKRVCEDNKCEHLVEVETLSPDEALDLFKKTVGPAAPDEYLVKEVCDRCGQLPLLIYAVGKALKRKRICSWEDALHQLQKGKFDKIIGLDSRVYAAIKLSIDILEHVEAKSCLFLCCLFPEDADIDMKMLIQLATGSQLICDGESRVLAMIDSLTESSLLLHSGKDNKTKFDIIRDVARKDNITKVHDIIRDVARDVAFSEYAFLHVKCNLPYFPSDDDDTGFWTRKIFLRLDVETGDVHFEEHQLFPDLHTLWLQCNNHPQQFLGGFFSIFGNLRFLMLQNVNISLEKFSLQPLGNLRTLTLLKCDIRMTDVSLFPKKLKTLCICHCDLPRPMDVANLKYLQKLEIQQDEPKLVMGSNVISSLSSLEELHIPNGYIIGPEKYEIDPIVMEISELARLKSVRFYFYDDDTFQGINVFCDIERYNILVGKPRKDEFHWKRYSEVTLGRVIRLYGNQLHSWEGLMARAQVVILGYSDFQVSSIFNGHIRAFEHLKRLYIKECDNMDHLATTSQYKIQNSLQHEATCFSQLTILKIQSCSKLKYLFCNNIAKGLVQLQKLSVKYCDSMEAIIMNEGSDEAIINFPKLKSLKLIGPRLASFYTRKANMHSGSTVPMDNSEPFFDGMVAFPSLKELYIYDCDNMGHLASISQEDEIQYSLQHTCFSKLTILHIDRCSSLKYLFCNNIAKSLEELQELGVNWCDSMEAIIMKEGTSDREIVNFPKLKSLTWQCTEKPPNFCVDLHSASTLSTDPSARYQHIFNGMVAFPSLECLYICDMKYTTVIWGKDCYNDTLSSFCKLKYLFVSSCDKLEIVIPQAMLHRLYNLEVIQVYDCNSLRTMFQPSIASDLTHLKKLKVNDCKEMREIIEAGEQVITDDGILFPELKVLVLVDLPGLTSKVPFRLPQLSSIYLIRLPQLRRLFHGANFEFYMPDLKKVKVIDCRLLEHIFEDVKGDKTSDACEYQDWLFE